MRTLRLAWLAVVARRGRLLALFAFSAVFLLAGTGAALTLKDETGVVHLDELFAVGGYTAPSALLLLGWLIGRLPLIAVVALTAGVVSEDRRGGLARLIAVRPVSPFAVYGVRLAVLAAIAFAICAVVMPAFDLLMLGKWAGPATLVLIAAYVMVYGGLTALLSVWTRWDGWIALLLAVLSTVWAALDRAGVLTIGAGVKQFFTFVLPPQPALFAIENAFANVQPIPWNAVAFAAGYGLLMLLLAAAALLRAER